MMEKKNLLILYRRKRNNCGTYVEIERVYVYVEENSIRNTGGDEWFRGIFGGKSTSYIL